MCRRKVCLTFSTLLMHEWLYVFIYIEEQDYILIVLEAMTILTKLGNIQIEKMEWFWCMGIAVFLNNIILTTIAFNVDFFTRPICVAKLKFTHDSHSPVRVVDTSDCFLKCLNRPGCKSVLLHTIPTDGLYDCITSLVTMDEVDYEDIDFVTPDWMYYHLVSIYKCLR